MVMDIKFKVWDSISKIMHQWNTIDCLAMRDFINLKHYTLIQYTGLKDRFDKEIYADDLLVDVNGLIIRVYSSLGGFVLKEGVWCTDLLDLNESDDLIIMPIANPQVISFIKNNMEVVGNVYENPDLINKT
jgi:uncharacterized phage protein (TIGR01671 family)